MSEWSYGSEWSLHTFLSIKLTVWLRTFVWSIPRNRCVFVDFILFISKPHVKVWKGFCFSALSASVPLQTSTAAPWAKSSPWLLLLNTSFVFALLLPSELICMLCSDCQSPSTFVLWLYVAAAALTPFRVHGLCNRSTLVFFDSSLFVLSDPLPVAVQSAGEAAVAEVVHTPIRARKEEGDPGHDSDGVGPSTTHLQLPAVEGPEDCLQEVGEGTPPPPHGKSHMCWLILLWSGKILVKV